MTLTTAALAQKIADDSGFVKGDYAEIMDRLLDLIKASLLSSEDVMVSGFVKWSVKSKRSRRGRNAQKRRGDSPPRQKGGHPEV